MAELTYPNRVNTKGIPALAGTPAIETIGAVATLVVTFKKHLALNENWSGLFLVDLTLPIVTGAQPVVFKTEGVPGYTPLMLFSGVQVTAADIVTTTGGVIECFYNRDTNALQLMGVYA